MAGEGERGFGLVVAVIAMAVAAMAAMALILATRTTIVGQSGALTRARAEAAADAGIAIMLHHLVALDQTALEALDGQPQQTRLGEAAITTRLIDERGKIALGHVEDETVTRLLAQQGLSGGALERARDGLLDWIDDDDDARPFGAEAPAYAAEGIAPRNRAPMSIDEMARIHGFSPALVERLRHVVTLEFAARMFDPAHAQPAALAAQAENGDASVATLVRTREQEGDRAALAGGDPRQLIGRPVTIEVEATVPGGRFRRELVVMVTGQRDHPYEVHAVR